MRPGAIIRSVTAREVVSDKAHRPGLEVTVITEDGSCGVAMATGGVSVGKHEVHFAYDRDDRWGGFGVRKAIDTVHDIIGRTLRGMDATRQRVIDETLIEVDGTPNKSRLGGNVTASVSAAVLKAGADSLKIPLYQHIGGVNACILPTPGVLCVLGSNRYGGGERAGGKPSYSFICHGFSTFAEASYASWRVRKSFEALLLKKHNVDLRVSGFGRPLIPAEVVEHDQELWDIMVEAIEESGGEGKIGIQVDVAAGCYYDKNKGVFVGLFSREDKTKEDLTRIYKDAVATYPFLIFEDPLDEEDYEGHAVLTKKLGIEIVGDDLFTTNMQRLERGIQTGACNAVLLKVNQIGTISEAFDLVQFAYKNGYGVMPCNSRGEGPDIADYAVGLNTGHIREGGLDPTTNRLLRIESELGRRAVFLGRAGLKP